MIETVKSVESRLTELAPYGPRWCFGSPASEPVRLLYGMSKVEPGTDWMVDSRTRADLLSLPAVCVTWILQGEIELEIEGRIFTAVAGDVVCQPVPGETTVRVLHGGGNTHVYVIIHHDYVIRRLTPVLRSGRLIKAAKSAAIGPSFDRIFEQGLCGNYADPVREEIDLFAFARTLEGSLSEGQEGSGEGRALLQLVDRLVHAALPARLTVRELALRVGESESQFARRFRRLAGMSVGAFITRLQLDEATRLLVETRLPLKTIAARVGFSDDQALAHAFRRHRGRTAGSLRQNDPRVSSS